MWQEKARWFNIPLSAGWPTVGVHGGCDRHVPRPVQHASGEARVVARNELAAAEVSTPRRVSRKAIHYGCAIPFVAVAARSLSQLMHDRETGTGPVEVPALEAQKEMEFDWD